MIVQPPLFLPGWEQEPCDTAPAPDEQAHTDLHASWIIPGDHGRPAGRGTYSRMRRIQTLTIKGDLL